MASVFELAAECGPDRVVAERFAEHFRDTSWTLLQGLESRCAATIHQDSDSNWWVSVLPSGLSRSGIGGEEDARLMTQIGHLLCERLRTASNYRYALVGVESEDFRYFSELDDDLVTLPFQGLVVCEAIWERLGRPTAFVPFEPGYFWRLYTGEVYGSKV